MINIVQDTVVVFLNIINFLGTYRGHVILLFVLFLCFCHIDVLFSYKGMLIHIRLFLKL